MKKRNIIIIIASILILIIALLLILILNNKKNDLEGITYDELFTYLDKGVNSELKGTYAFITNANSNGTVDILALKKDNTTLEIATTEYSDWSNGISNLFYSDGKVYYLYADDTIWSIDLSKGNGNYELTSYDFLEGYISGHNNDNWFYVKDNSIYYLNGADLHICNLTKEKCEYQNLDSFQGLDIRIDNKLISKKYDSVYVDNNQNIYILSEDKENIYKIDTKGAYDDYGLTKASYKKVSKLDDTAHLVTCKKKLEGNNIEVTYVYSDPAITYVKRANGNKKEFKNYNPVTLLSNNYLMVMDNRESFFSSSAKFIDLNKNEVVDKLFNYNINSDIWFVEKN